MDEEAQDPVGRIVSKETWTVEDQQELLKELFTVNDAADKFRAILAQLEAENPEPRGSAALKVGIGRYMLGDSQGALQVLSEATDNKDRRHFQALCYKSLTMYDKAIEQFELARTRGWDSGEIDIAIIELQALCGQLTQAEKALSKLPKSSEDTADFQYLRGLICEFTDRGEQALEAYDKARQIDPAHPRATFRLAYYLDLHGQEEEAVELYKQCLAHRPVYASALLNLAVLYEDIGKNDLAAACLRRILSNNPNHARARLFLRDVEAARTMYYDEDRAKRIARRNALLDTPVSDFELSVRARNCLKKMNIRTLGDLVKTTEAGLLSYKNFGETSLKEVKDMIGSKGLRLGQALEEDSDLRPSRPANVQDEGVLGTPLAQIDFSVRVRGAMEALRVRTLGDLAAKTDAELLACKNFGQTSLNEVRMRLREYGLRLREPE